MNELISPFDAALVACKEETSFVVRFSVEVSAIGYPISNDTKLFWCEVRVAWVGLANMCSQRTDAVVFKVEVVLFLGYLYVVLCHHVILTGVRDDGFACQSLLFVLVHRVAG